MMGWILAELEQVFHWIFKEYTPSVSLALTRQEGKNKCTTFALYDLSDAFF